MKMGSTYSLLTPQLAVISLVLTGVAFYALVQYSSSPPPPHPLTAPAGKKSKRKKQPDAQPPSKPPEAADINPDTSKSAEDVIPGQFNIEETRGHEGIVPKTKKQKKKKAKTTTA